MADTWSTTENVPVVKLSHHSGPPPDPLRRLVRESLWRELQSRRERAPHAQLGVVVGADCATVEKAFARLRTQFNPDAYVDRGPEAMALAREIYALIQAAFAQLREVAPRPRPWRRLISLLR